MTHHRPAFAVLVALTVAALGACSGGSGKSSKPTKTAVGGSITVTARDISFDVGEIRTTAGTLTVNFKNEGAVTHDFKIEGTSLLLKADGGKSATGTVTLAKGTYKFECTVPGHKPAGMRGTVVVG